MSDNTNPKDLLGIKKENISLIPPEGIRGIAKAMEFGAKKYGAYNWRDKKVQYKIYLDAIMRHTLALVEGQDLDPDSNLSHLDHIGANVVILKDAIKHQCLVDNRDIPKSHLSKKDLEDLVRGPNPFISYTLKEAVYEDFMKKYPKTTLTRSGNEQHNITYGGKSSET